MRHRDTYLKLLSPALRDRLLDLLEQQGVYAQLHALSARVEPSRPLPYVHMDIAPSPHFTAHCGGIFVDIRSLIGHDGADRYYLPVLGISAAATAVTLQHELQHLRDLLDFIERDPSYPDRALRLGIGSLTDLNLLEQSIGFELFKVFTFEPQAFRLGYDLGETWIDIPFLFGKPIRYACTSADKLVMMHMANCVTQVQRRFIEKFPAHVVRIQRAVRDATNRFGGTLFGDRAYKRVCEVNAMLFPKMLHQLTRWALEREKSGQ